MISTALGYNLYGNNLQQSIQSTAAEPVVTQLQTYYNANIGKVKSVSDLVNNYKLLSYATQAFGLSDMTYAKALLTKVLTSDLTDSKSVANQLNDSRYVAFAKAFSFNTDGSIKTTAQLQTGTQITATANLFAANTTLDAADTTTASNAYAAAVASMTSIGQLETNPVTLGYVLTAYGIDPNTATSTFEQTLESDLSKPGSYVNSQADSGYLALQQAVNVDSNGAAVGTVQAQTTTAINATTDAYSAYAATDATSQANAATETSYYLSQIGGITTVKQLVSDPRLVAYVKQAYQLPNTATASDVQSALTSDTTNPSSFARQSPYPAFLALAKAFNFSTAGAAQTITQFQTNAQQQATTSLYAQRQTSDSTTAAAATAYYNANIGSVTSVAGLEENSRLLSYVETAYGISAATPNATLDQITENTNNFVLNQAVGVNTDGTAITTVQAQALTNINATTNAYTSFAPTDATSQASAATETSYYLSQISGITTASALTSDTRLVAYVKQAFQLPATATASDIQSALTSDTTDPTSFANTSDPSYLALAKAFNFSTSGNAQNVTQLQSLAQQTTATSLYALRQTSDPATAAAATAYFKANIGTVKSVGDLEKNTKLLGYLETAYNISAATPNTTISQITENAGNYALAYALGINTDGTATTSIQAQTATNINATTNAYSSYAASDATSQASAATETSYYQSQIGVITTASALTSDSRLVAYLEQAFQLPATATASTIKSALTSDTTDPNSFANQSDPSYLALAKAFTFSTTGAAQNVTQVQTAAQQNTTTSLYAQRQTSDSSTAAAATAYFKANIGNVKSIGALESDPKLLSYVETAYSISAATPTASLNQLIENKNSFARSTTNGTLLALRLGLNIDSNGNATNPLTAQSTTNQASTITAYLANTASDTASQAAAKTATLYYQEAIKNVTSVSSLLADPKLVAYVEKAYSIPTNTTSTVLTQVLTSDLTNLKSVANTKGSNYASLASAFDFTSTGLIGTETQGAQSKAQLYTTNSGYIDQQMENDASAQNPGIGLALYLQFNASKITDAYSVLADKKLTTIFQTALGLSSTSSAGSIESQAATINSKINLSDLKDPTKLKAFIQRFSVLYDLNPPAVSTPSTPASLITGSDTPLTSVSDLFGTADPTLTTLSLFGG